MSKVTAIVLAAGQGKRMNTGVAKQFLVLKDKPVLYYSLNAFEESLVDDIILVTGSGQEEYCRKNIIEPNHFTKVSMILEGGKERYDSVYQALLNTKSTDYVLIHDGARPFITKESIETIIKNVIKYDACIVGIPVKDTIKVVDSDGNIIASPNRDTLWSAQTPQAFKYNIIKKAYDMFYCEEDKRSVCITDDAMVYQNYMKLPVKILLGDYNNIKLTTPEDLTIAEGILNRLLCEKNKKKQQFFQES